MSDDNLSLPTSGELREEMRNELVALRAERDALLADLDSGKEIVGDMMAFIDANIEGSGSGDVVITTSDSHGDALVGLMDGVQAWLKGTAIDAAIQTEADK